jgi:hypothetical protein
LKILVGSGAHSEHALPTRCDIKPRSVERSINTVYGLFVIYFHPLIRIVYSLYFSKIKVLLDSRVHYELDEIISKESRGIPSGPIIQTPPYFPENEDSALET